MTDQTLPPPVPRQDQQKSGGRNCWVIGCSGCLIVLLVLIVAGWLLSWQIKRGFSSEPFEPIELSEAQKRESEAKLRSAGMLEGREEAEVQLPEEGLVLTEADLNYLISRNPDIADVVRVDLEPERIRAEMRVPLDENDPDGKRLTLGGTIDVRQKGEVLEIYLTELKIGNFSLPKSLMREMGKEDLGAEIFSDPETRRQFRENVERVEVRKDEILIVPKPKAVEE